MEKSNAAVKGDNKKGKILAAGILSAAAAIGVAAVLLRHFLYKEEFWSEQVIYLLNIKFLWW